MEKQTGRVLFDEEHAVYRMLFDDPEVGRRLVGEISQCVAPGWFMLKPDCSIERYYALNERQEECVVVKRGYSYQSNTHKILIPRSLIKKVVHEESSNEAI